MDLLRDLIRASALEAILARVTAGTGPSSAAPRSVSPAVPAARALRPASDGTGDVFTLRCGSPASAMVMGADPREILRQHLGKASAPASGRDPGGFPTDLERGLLGPCSVPGTLVEVLSGMALAFRLREEPRVALLVDDLASSASGDWHEGLNFAAVRHVPMVLVVDGPARGSGGLTPLSGRARAYGFEARSVAGSDPREVEKVIWAAVEAARTGGGLQVVEVDPPGTDPVDRLADALLAADAVAPGEVEALLSAAREEMEDALADVAGEADPDPSAALYPGTPAPHRPWAAGADPSAPDTPQ